MSILLVGLGLVLVIEGLVFALAPDRLEELLAALSQLPVETRRMLGLAGVAAGVFLIWLAGPL